MATHVLDTSAVLAHYFQEPGAEIVNSLLSDRTVEPAMATVSLLELKLRLSELVVDPAEVERTFHLYADELIEPIATTKEIAEIADRIFHQAGGSISLVEAIVAATAHKEHAILVHRTPGLAGVDAAALECPTLALQA